MNEGSCGLWASSVGFQHARCPCRCPLNAVEDENFDISTAKKLSTVLYAHLLQQLSNVQISRWTTIYFVIVSTVISCTEH